MSAEARRTSPLAHLLHALNQPLTGLQCSLELALAQPRKSEDYIRTLRDGLELTGRMRVLVEALRSLVDADGLSQRDQEPVALDSLLQNAVADLLPVAESRNTRLLLQCDTGLVTWADPRFLEGVLFRSLDSALGLAHSGSELHISALREPTRLHLEISWDQEPAPEPSSSPQLGILIAQAGWEQLGAEWNCNCRGSRYRCDVRLPLAIQPASTHNASEYPK